MKLRLNSRWITILLSLFVVATVAFIFVFNTPTSDENIPETPATTTDEFAVPETDQTPWQMIQPEMQVDALADCQALRLSYPPKCVDIGITTTTFNDEGLPIRPIEPGQ
ncbi:MAG: hypothetical protein RLP44_24545 [Aggregatilineales bacterium]